MKEYQRIENGSIELPRIQLPRNVTFKYFQKLIDPALKFTNGGFNLRLVVTPLGVELFESVIEKLLHSPGVGFCKKTKCKKASKYLGITHPWIWFLDT